MLRTEVTPSECKRLEKGVSSFNLNFILIYLYQYQINLAAVVKYFCLTSFYTKIVYFTFLINILYEYNHTCMNIQINYIRFIIIKIRSWLNFGLLWKLKKKQPILISLISQPTNQPINQPTTYHIYTYVM